jgi:hypothetical protein
MLPKELQDAKEQRCAQTTALLVLEVLAALSRVCSKYGMELNTRQSTDGTHVCTVRSPYFTDTYEDWEVVVNLAPTEEKSKQLMFGFMQEASDETDPE